MKFKETIKKDWRVDVGFMFNFIILISLTFILLGKLSLLDFSFIYLFGVLVSLIIGAADDFGQALIFPILLFAYQTVNKEEKKIKKYLNDFNKNVHKSAVVILAYYDRYSIKYSLKENYDLSEIKLITEYLKLSRGNDFSFYFGASQDDVRNIMFDSAVREVLFVGHGDSHTFVLNLDDDIFYCEFNDIKCSKDIIHQVHCGTKTGKSLVEYVVPKENYKICFLSNKSIRYRDIKKWFKNRIKELENNKN